MNFIAEYWYNSFIFNNLENAHNLFNLVLSYRTLKLYCYCRPLAHVWPLGYLSERLPSPS